jgi:hypothetical protein
VALMAAAECRAATAGDATAATAAADKSAAVAIPGNQR